MKRIDLCFRKVSCLIFSVSIAYLFRNVGRFSVVLLCVGICFGCTQKRNELIVSAGFNRTPASVLYLSKERDTVWLTDFFPLMESADSVTSQDMIITPVAPGYEKFAVLPKGTSALGTMDFWLDGFKMTLFVIRDYARTKDTVRPWATSECADEKGVHFIFSDVPEKVVALWQNTQFPDEFLSLTGKELSVAIPSQADTMFRSFIRLIAQTGDGRLTNDVLVPLQYGKVIGEVSELTRSDKQGLVLYSLMIDRFNNGNKENDRPLNRPDVLPTVDFQGGDFAGITAKIKDGFFTDMGVNTIWISPVAKNADGAWGLDKDPFTRFAAYHGYWPVNPTVVDSHFGTETELREMLDQAHANGLNVILDYVANHLHEESHILQEHPDWATPMYLPDGRPNVRLFDEHRLTTWFDTFLPTLDLAREEVCEPMTDSALYWLQKFDFDGFRHDAAKHIPELYWRTLTRKIKQHVINQNIFQIGETYGKPELLRSYVKSGMLDSQFDFGIYHSAVNAFGTYTISMFDLYNDLDRSLNSYGYHHLMGNISGNHDKPRFISVAGGTVSLNEDTKAAGRKRKIGVGDTLAYRKLALLEAFMFSIPGIPCIYQGDEYGVPGANDPDNRKMMCFDGYNRNEALLLKTVKELAGLRRTDMPLIYGDLIPLHSDGDVIAFVRIYMGRMTVAAFNRSGEIRSLELKLPVEKECFAPVSHFGQQGIYQEGVLKLVLNPYAFEILTDKNV